MNPRSTARPAFVPLLAAAVIVASALVAPTSTRERTAVGHITRVDDGWLELAAEMFDPFLQYQFTPTTQYTSRNGQMVSLQTLQVGSRVQVFWMQTPGERGISLHKILLLQESPR
jgi:hypothetical protein